MPYKNLLVHLDDSDAGQGRVAAAIALAQAHEAHLTGLYVGIEPALPGTIGSEVPPEFLRGLEAKVEQQVEAAKERFTRQAEREGLTADCRTAVASYMRVPGTVALHARYADLAIVGQPETEGAAFENPNVAEGVVMAAGRPILIIPYIGAGEAIGRRVLVAWDGGREATRAVNDALPLLERAHAVTVLTINPSKGRHGERPGADLGLHLARHGIRVDVAHIEARDLSVGDALLSRAADDGADLLVMGAYGHSRMREWVLGGATRQILGEMTVPVFMSH